MPDFPPELVAASGNQVLLWHMHKERREWEAGNREESIYRCLVCFCGHTGSGKSTLNIKLRTGEVPSPPQ